MIAVAPPEGLFFDNRKPRTYANRSPIRWNIQELFRRVGSGFASVTCNARRAREKRKRHQPV